MGSTLLPDGVVRALTVLHCSITIQPTLLRVGFQDGRWRSKSSLPSTYVELVWLIRSKEASSIGAVSRRSTSRAFVSSSKSMLRAGGTFRCSPLFLLGASLVPSTGVRECLLCALVRNPLQAHVGVPLLLLIVLVRGIGSRVRFGSFGSALPSFFAVFTTGESTQLFAPQVRLWRLYFDYMAGTPFVVFPILLLLYGITEFRNDHALSHCVSCPRACVQAKRPRTVRRFFSFRTRATRPVSNLAAVSVPLKLCQRERRKFGPAYGAGDVLHLSTRKRYFLP